MDMVRIMTIVAAIAIVAVMARLFFWVKAGGLYYRQYPGAKLMEDMAKAGQLDVPAMNEVIRRVGGAEDQRAVVAEIRQERGLDRRALRK